jgi:AcrR family transcriptional regulator
MERVAARADVSKPVLYSHFANRAELLMALLEQYWADLDLSVAERLQEVHDFDGQLEAIVRGYFDAIEKGGLTLHLLLGAEAGAPIVEQARSQRYKDAERQWSATYEQKLGLPSPVAQAAAALVRSGIEGVARYWLRTPGADREACVNTCIAVARGGLHALAEPERDSDATRASRRKKR